MSLERTALRLAATMALSNGFKAPFPTMAQNRVFDSRQDPIAGIAVGQFVPTLILYTDDDKGDELSQNGGPPFLHHCHLVMEISIGIAKEYRAEGSDDAVLALVAPQTEPELEVALDAFEAQISRVFRTQGAPWGAWLGRTINRIDSWQSNRFVEHETNVRLASRQITANVKLQIEDDPRTEMGGDEPQPYIPSQLGGLLAAIIADAGPFAPTATAMQTMLLSNAPMLPLVLDPLQRIRFIETDAYGARPDGVAEATIPT